MVWLSLTSSHKVAGWGAHLPSPRLHGTAVRRLEQPVGWPSRGRVVGLLGQGCLLGELGCRSVSQSHRRVWRSPARPAPEVEQRLLSRARLVSSVTRLQAREEESRRSLAASVPAGDGVTTTVTMVTVV